MATSRRGAAAHFVLLALLTSSAAAQGTGGTGGTATGTASNVLSRALDLESAGKCAEAFPLYRKSLGEGDVAGALLGFERCAEQIGRPDTLLTVVDSILLSRPRDPIVRMVQIRTLTTMQRFDEARTAFNQWVVASPRDPAPYREFARQLLDQGRTRAADTVLQLAARSLGSARDIAPEMAELRAALGMWEASARAWRDAMSVSPFLEQSAIYVLGQAPAAARDSVRAVLTADPLDLHARQILSGLEMRWRSAQEAWAALSTLPPNDSTVRAWLEFAAEAEQQSAWRAASDAYVAALAHGADRSLSLKAATASLAGGDPNRALSLLASAGTMDTSLAATVVLLRVRALSQLGQPVQADSVLRAAGPVLDSGAVNDAMRAIAWGWVRVGDLVKARAALEHAGGEMDDRAAAWIALYEGDLKTARTGLRRIDETSRESVIAMALLARTRADSSRTAGNAFLSLARGDTAGAGKLFEQAAGEVPDAAPLLLGIAARLHATTADVARSLTIWQTLVERYAQSPEAAEAELEWARLLRKRGDATGAVARLEHLILTYPQSALVPQARRELELAKGGIPPVR